MSNDPQLIGGFLAALLTFIRTTGSEAGNSCQWEMDGMHKLKDIGMSCSRWFIQTEDEFTIAMLIPYKSQLLINQKFDIISRICEQIISTFLIFRMFDMNVDQDIGYVKDYSSDFSNSLDIIVFEHLHEFFGSNLQFESSGEIDVYDTTNCLI